VAELAAVAHRYGARIAVDAAQLAPHAPVDLATLGADYVALSGHKLYAPFGAGVLAGRSDWLDAVPPYLAGGGASAAVSANPDVDPAGGRTPLDVTWADGPARHEAGTPNLLGAVALATACRELSAADRSGEHALVTRLRDGIAALPNVEELRLFDATAPRVGIVSFAVPGVDAVALAETLGRDHGIGVRAGLFCAHPLTRRLLREATDRLDPGREAPVHALRASVGIGTTPEHIDRLLNALRATIRG
jgi:selenocysteine lyase/cysteine desulfurase